MKRICFFCVLFAVCLSFNSCNDEWKNELYQNYASFKAILNSEGVSDIYIRYNPEGDASYRLPVLISGSQKQQSNLKIKVGVDNDTLAILNQEKYFDRSDLYFRQLPEQFFSFESDVCPIAAGQNSGIFPINFNLTGLDLVDDWVLPLQIIAAPSYVNNEYLGRDKALLNINLFNDYSGIYSATALLVYFKGSNRNPITADIRRAKVVDENSVFIYAGTISERDMNRKLYKIIIRFEPGTELDDENNTITGPVTLIPGDEENRINLNTTGDCTYEIKKVSDVKKPYLLHYYVTIKLNYDYDDITSNPEKAITYSAKGTLTMERQINTLIPDEDQAIQW